MGVENKGKVDIGLSRRQLLKGLGVAALASGAGAALQACWPGGDSEPTIVDRVVTKEVEKIVTQNIVQQVPVDKVVVKEVVKEVPVEKIVERVVTKEVPVEKIVEKIVTVMVTPKAKDAETKATSTAEPVEDGAPDAIEETATPTPKPEQVVMVERGGIKVAGVPEKATNVDVAKGEFKNTIGLGTEAFLAEPGGLLVGADFGYTGTENPMGRNPQGWEAMYRSGGSINTFNPVTQEVLHYELPYSQNVPEGGWALFSGGYMAIEVAGVKIQLKPEEGINYLVYIRGYYGDNKQDTDRNATAIVTEFKAGHTLAMMFQARKETNTAFISEGQFKQMVVASHSAGTNCGDGGCSKLRVVYVDLNTKAFGIWEHTADRELTQQTAGQGWSVKDKNY